MFPIFLTYFPRRNPREVLVLEFLKLEVLPYLDLLA